MYQPATTAPSATISDGMEGKFLIFILDGQEYALPIEQVVDIISAQPITRIPNCPDYLRGVTNLRGKVIPLVDLRLRFSKTFRPYSDRTCIIVLENAGAPVGLIVDGVNEVSQLEDEQISLPPTFHASGESRFVQGIGKAQNGVKLILDYQAVLDMEAPDEAPGA